MAHFFRRAYANLSIFGVFGLIATNTIAQGDTRSTGLRSICKHGGTIYAARRRYKWPGDAAVVVSVVHVSKSPIPGPFDLDGRSVEQITAYLFHAGGHDDPERLIANAGKSFQGSITYGMGFTFSDNDSSGESSPLQVMHDLLAKDPRNQERIFPFLGGDEVNNDPRHRHSRYVIFFNDMPENEARKWPDLIEILERKVKPDRATKAADVAAWPWWQFWRIRSELFAGIADLDRALVINCGACPHMAFAYAASQTVFAHSLDVFTLQGNAAFGILQSRAHEVWARFFASSLEDRLRYTPSDCFESFPFPPKFEANPALEAAGKTYYEFRADLMVRNNEGLTKTYNRFHDPDERSPDILKLRELHAAMDKTALEAYGWHDLAKSATYEFLLDYEEDEEDDDESNGARRRKKPWRYRWPDDFRDEVLARLLELNRQRAEEERLSGAAAEKPGKKSKGKSTRGKKKPTNDNQLNMFSQSSSKAGVNEGSTS